ncbi:hypothetical protein ACFSC4_16195 [Deinococcus malanensis]|uniref:hypothetical protein n=1 Tax=Deinococcus malanensis TaxID=1706855 RepID=UPI00362A4ED3
MGRLVIGDSVYSPKADQKLLILHYTVHNPQKREVRYHWSDLSFTAVDAQDRNHNFVQAVARDGTRDALTMRLKPAQKVDVVTAVLVPAAGPVPKLIVSRESGAPVLRYDLRGKVTALPAPFADPADPYGASARAQVSAHAATFLPMGWLDIRLDEVKFTTEPLNGQAPATGKRYLTAVFTLKNHGPRETRYHWGISSRH